MNICTIVSFGPSEDQLVRKEQKRLWEKNQMTREEKLKRKGREIRDELGYIPTKKQQNLYEKEGVEKGKRRKKVEEIMDFLKK